HHNNEHGIVCEGSGEGLRVFPVVLWFGLCLAGAFPAVEAVAQSWIIQPIESKAQSTDDLSAVLDVGYAGVSILDTQACP
ncbi:MAG TPA: hypothetical protein PK329_03225, partial [Myxococcota bacterium]|nr:hypothetical protein [Myxococcota bacterium]HOS61971.1 hypothetical protein [Myxococcota bacterium]HPC91706.1 hypothetical protein [Myxococcota bacterium]HPL25050.1 hypothetical protein [Myxococcota bacterium]HQE73373.1 hypothetical protein [Myxococcota bacterium]